MDIRTSTGRITSTTAFARVYGQWGGNWVLYHPLLFRPLYLSISIIRPFDRALLLISGDIDENPGPVSFDKYIKTSTTLAPSTSSESYYSIDETVNTTPPDFTQMSHLLKSRSNCHRTTLQDTPHTNSDPLDSLNTKLKLVLTHVKVSLPLCHIVDQLGPRQKAYKIAA